MRSMRSKATRALILCMIVAALALTACTRAAALATPQPASTAAPAPTDLFLAASTAAPTAPTPVPAANAWAPAPRTKTSGCVSQGGLPDPACTPGAIDPRVNQADLSTTICARSYTATVRPPVNVTEKIKREQMAAYGLQGVPLSTVELDHLVSLELGGAPQDVANLWPEPWTGDGNAHKKDAVENFLNREVCRGTIPLVEAQQMIATDWLAVYRSHGLQPAP